MKKSQKKTWLGDLVLVSKVLLMVAVPTSLLLLHVSNQYRITELGYEIADVTSEHRALLEENKKLTVEARVQERSDRISKLARQQFGLVETRPDQVITVKLEDAAAGEEHARLNTINSATGYAAVQ